MKFSTVVLLVTVSVSLGLCTPAMADAATGNVLIYDGLTDDLGELLARSDNRAFYVTTVGRESTHQKFQAFASDLGIPMSLEPQPDGSQSAVVKNAAGEMEYAYQYLPSEAGKFTDELWVAKRSFMHLSGSPVSLEKMTAFQIAENLLDGYGLPGFSGQGGPDNRRRAEQIITKLVQDGGSRFITQDAGFYRVAGNGRQVANSAIRVTLDSLTGAATGIALLNWLPLGLENENVELKSLEMLREDIVAAVGSHVSTAHTLRVTDCVPTYYQIPSMMVPSVTCYGKMQQDGQFDGVAPKAISVSMVQGLSFWDDYEAWPLEDPDLSPGGVFDYDAVAKDGMDLDDWLSYFGYQEVSGKKFGSYYTTDESAFYAMADKFRDKFTDRWPDYAMGWSTMQKFTWDSLNYADAVDLVFVMTHGNIQNIMVEGGNQFAVNGPSGSSDVSRLGLGDAEFMTYGGCLTGSAVYCAGKSATHRMEQAAGWWSVFAGLHTFSSNHGTSFGNSTIQKTIAKKYSKYLQDGYSLVEAWHDAELNSNYWHINRSGGCKNVGSPETSCSYSDSSCSRWSHYPSTFYIDEKRTKTISNTGGADIRFGAAGYDVDIYYTYQSETVPIRSTGHSLP